MPVSSLEYLRRADFTFTRQLGSVWKDDPRDVPELHHQVRADILARVEASARGTETPLGLVLKGDAGTGKTHLLGELRRMAMERNMFFLYVDMTDVRDFAKTLLLGITDSLTRAEEGRIPQLRHVIAALFMQSEGLQGRAVSREEGLEYAAAMAALDEFSLREATKKLVDVLWKIRRGSLAHAPVDIIRTLLGLNTETSQDFWSLCASWLQGTPLDEFDGRSRLQLANCAPDPWKIVQDLFWVLHFRGPTVLAFDQLDNCFPLLEAARIAPDHEEGKMATLVLGEIGRGFGALRDSLNPSTLAVVACFGGTWELLKRRVLASFTDRYTEPHTLLPVTEASMARDLVAKRLTAGREIFSPPSPTWPFTSAFFASAANLSPREILRYCDRHRDACLAHGEVRERNHVEENPFLAVVPVALPPEQHAFDARLAELMAAVDPAPFLEDSDEAEGALGTLFAEGCAWCVLELEVPEHTFFEVESASGGRRTCPAIHLRWKRIVAEAGNLDAEWHVCLRALLRKHHSAYNNRLRAAMTESGIDRHLSRRRLVILRDDETPPSGKVGVHLREEFLRAGGTFVAPQEFHIRTLVAVRELAREAAASSGKDEGAFRAWLRERKPLSSLEPMRALLEGWTFELPGPSEGGATPPAAGADPVHTGKEEKEGERASNGNQAWSPESSLVLGHSEGAPRARLSTDDLARHVVVLAGSGSGKTVLLKRLVEEAALAGIPSVVFDSAGDLAQLGDRWPEAPAAWDPGDALRADQYFERAEVRIWTPGCTSGRPFTLRSLPDFSAVRDDPDAFALATATALETLTDLAVVGGGAKAKRMTGVLAAAVEAFGQGDGGDIQEFLEFLRRLPIEAAGGISSAPALAREAADNLQSSLYTMPVLFGDAPAVDAELLWGRSGGSGGTPVSVVSLGGIPGERNRQVLVGHVVFSLLTWARRHPPIQAPGRMNGLIVLDEAKDFLPSVRTSACKQGLLRLAAQGRKYGLGLVMATQNPKDLDGNALSNIGTWFCGRASTPRIITQIQAFLEERGADAAEIATLKNGAFQFSSPMQGSPRLVQVPLSLSHHPDRAPLSEEEILERARR